METKPSNSLAENEHVRKAMDTSQQFFRYSLEVLKRPAQASEQVGAAGFLNGIIAQAAFAVLIPLILFIVLLGIPFLDPSFFEVVIKPWFYLLILLACVNGGILLSVKLCKGNADIKAIVGRFGTYMIVPLALVAVSLVTAVIQLRDVATYALNFAMLGMLAAIALTIYTFKQQSDTPEQGIDAIYGILITYLILGIALYLLGRTVVNTMLTSFF